MTADDSSDLRAKLKEVLNQLDEAEKALSFYADSANYISRGVNTRCFHNVVVGDYDENSEVKGVFVAGNRARKYFKQFRP